jgi:hypothetical protein
MALQIGATWLDGMPSWLFNYLDIELNLHHVLNEPGSFDLDLCRRRWRRRVVARACAAQPGCAGCLGSR